MVSFVDMWLLRGDVVARLRCGCSVEMWFPLWTCGPFSGDVVAQWKCGPFSGDVVAQSKCGPFSGYFVEMWSLL